MDRLGITVNAIYRKAKVTITDLNKSFVQPDGTYETSIQKVLERFVTKANDRMNSHIIIYHIVDHRLHKPLINRNNVTIINDDKIRTVGDVLVELGLSLSSRDYIAHTLIQSKEYGPTYLPCINFKETMPYVLGLTGRISRMKVIFPPQPRHIKWDKIGLAGQMAEDSSSITRPPDSNFRVDDQNGLEEIKRCFDPPIQQEVAEDFGGPKEVNVMTEAGGNADSSLLWDDNSIHSPTAQMSSAGVTPSSETVDDDLKSTLNKWSMKDGHNKDIRTLLATVDTVAPVHVEWKALSLSEIMANPTTLKKHYRNAILTFHPDRHQTANAADKYRVERIFHAIHESYKREG